MARRGRTPKPATQRSSRTRGPALAVVVRRHEPPDVIPAPPERGDGQPLCNAALLAWDAFWLSPMAGLLDAVERVDRYTVDRWIRCVDALERVEGAIRRVPLVRGSTGQPALSPLVGYARQLQAELARYQEVLGLTPLARARLGLNTAAQRMTAEGVAALLRTPP